MAVGGIISGYWGNFATAVTRNVRVTEFAGTYVAFPDCEAVIEQVEAIAPETKVVAEKVKAEVSKAKKATKAAKAKVEEVEAKVKKSAPKKSAKK